MEKKKQILIKQIMLAVSLCVLIVVSSAYAWFTMRNQNNFFAYSGSAELEIKMYAGIDGNHDGVLDSGGAGGDGLPLIDTSAWTNRAAQYTDVEGVSEHGYVELSADYNTTTNEFEDVYAGKCIVYKFVIINTSATASSAVSINMASLRNYFYRGLYDETVTVDGVTTTTDGFLKSFYDTISGTMAFPTTLPTAEYTNSVHLFFEFTNIEIREYAKGSSSDSFITGYSGLTKSSVTSEQVGGVTNVVYNHPDGYTEITNYNLSRFANEEEFISDLVIAPSRLVEINFRLTNTQDTRAINDYINEIYNTFSDSVTEKVGAYLDPLIAETDRAGFVTAYKDAFDLQTLADYDAVKLNIAKRYIYQMYNNEIDFLYDPNASVLSGSNYALTIDYFMIYGVQQAEATE